MQCHEGMHLLLRRRSACMGDLLSTTGELGGAGVGLVAGQA
jgi:hypothetical protein